MGTLRSTAVSCPQSRLCRQQDKGEKKHGDQRLRWQLGWELWEACLLKNRTNRVVGRSEPEDKYVHSKGEGVKWTRAHGNREQQRSEKFRSVRWQLQSLTPAWKDKEALGWKVQEARLEGAVSTVTECRLIWKTRGHNYTWQWIKRQSLHWDEEGGTGLALKERTCLHKGGANLLL